MIVWIVLVVLNMVVIISVSMFGSMVIDSVFLMFIVLISDVWFGVFSDGSVKMLWYFMFGLKIRLNIEIVIMMSRMLFGM